MAQSTKVQTAIRIYTALLWLYPRAHRQDYGPLMVQLFQDQCKEAYTHQHIWGLLQVWLRTLRDLVTTAIQEHLHLAAQLGLANQPLTPLPWRQVLLVLLPGLWTFTSLIEILPTLFILILPVIWVLRARTTHQQLVGMTVFPFIGMALAETARFLTLYNTVRGGILTLSSVVQLTAVLALVGLTFAQFAASPTPATER